jgi:hypothetical protein
MQHLDDTEYKKIVINALTSAQVMLKNDAELLGPLLPDSSAFEQTQQMIINELRNTQSKFTNGMALSPMDAAAITRALVEYNQKVESSQGRLLNTPTGLDDVRNVQQQVMKIAIAQMRFQQDMVQDQSQNQLLTSRMGNRP